jgi:hypothetical protein
MQYRLKLSLGVLLIISGAVNLYGMDDESKKMSIVQDDQAENQDKKRKEPMDDDSNVDSVGSQKKMKGQEQVESRLPICKVVKVVVAADQMFQPIGQPVTGEKLPASHTDYLRAPTTSVATVRAESTMPDDIDFWWQRTESRANTVVGHSCKMIEDNGEYFP